VSIFNLAQDHDRLQKNYTRLAELRMIDTETLAMKQAEITRLQQELDHWKPVRIPTEPKQRIRCRAVPESEPRLWP
jgi:hypothetical protein